MKQEVITWKDDIIRKNKIDEFKVTMIKSLDDKLHNFQQKFNLYINNMYSSLIDERIGVLPAYSNKNAGI